MEEENIYKNIDIDLLVPNEEQPRKIFDEVKINELAMSIKEYGILNPIIVRKKEDKYEIIAGERRYRAALQLGLKEVPVLIKKLNEGAAKEIALVENLQREKLNPVEEAVTFQEIIGNSTMKQEELAKAIGKSQSYVANKIRLLGLRDEILAALINKIITEKHARTLVSLNKEKQLEYLKIIIDNKLSVKKLEQIIKEKEKKFISVEEINKKNKKEKESDTMNETNFFPNLNNEGNQTIMQQPIMSQPQTAQQPMISQPQMMPQQPAMESTPVAPQPINIEPMATSPITEEERPIIENIQPLFNMDLQPEMSSQIVPEQTSNLQPEMSSQDVPEQTPNLQPEMVQPQQNIEQPQVIQPQPMIQEKPAVIQQTFEEPSQTEAINQIQELNDAAELNIEKAQKLVNFLVENQIPYKAYSNDYNSCVIIEF